MEHLTLPDIAGLLADGRPEAARLVRHLAEICPDCGELYHQAEALIARFRHWNPEVAILEGLPADGLFAGLVAGGGGYADWNRQIEQQENLQTWGVAWVALERAREILAIPGHDKAGQARDLARLAAKIAETLGAFYHPDWVADLKALSCATAAVAAKASGADDVRSQLEQVIAAATALHEGTGDDAVGREVRDLLSKVLRAEAAEAV
jgi:hypothetical protein